MTKDDILNCIATSGGGSGTGVSFYRQAMNCGQKARLNALLKGGGGGSFATDTGTYFHAMMEWYYGGEGLLEFNDFQLDDAQTEALRLFRAYAKVFGPGDFARVVGCEMFMPEDGAEKAVHDMMGVAPFTGRIDMVVELDEAACERLGAKRPEIAGHLEPGIFLWDFKTKGQSDKSAAVKAAWNVQFLAYQMAYCAQTGVEPIGMISDYVIRTKVPKFYSCFTAFPDDTEQAMVRQYLQEGRRRFEEGLPNLEECFNYGECFHRKTGNCRGVKKEIVL